MFTKTMRGLALVTLFINCCAVAVRPAGPISRSCPPCPTNSAQYCNVCAGTGRFDNLIVQNSVTLCPGVTLPCFCCYVDEIQVNAQGMQSSDIEQSVSRFTVAPGTVVTGWAIAQSGSQPETITAQFAVPQDYNPAIGFTLVLHYLIDNAPAILHRSPDSVNFEVGITFAGNGDNLTTLVPTVETTGDQAVATTTGTFHYQVSIPVNNVTVTPGNFAYVTVTRIATTDDTEYADDAYLAEVAFYYQKVAC